MLLAVCQQVDDLEQVLECLNYLNTYTFHITPYDLAFLGTIFIGLTFAVLIWFTQKSANQFLALALVVIVFGITRILAINIGLSTYITNWSRLPLQFSLAFGPLIFFYVFKITRPEFKFRSKDLLHFSPLLLELGAQALEIGNSTKTGAATFETRTFQQLNPLLHLLACVSVIIYLYLSHRLIQDYYSRLRTVLMDRPRFAFRRLDTALLLLALFCPLSLFNGSFCLIVAFVLIGMAAQAMLKPDSGVQQIMPIAGRADAKEKGRRLKDAVVANRLYEDAELTLVTLAVKLMIHPHDLSRIINMGQQKNFSDFINEFRVRAVVRKMQDPAFDRLTLLGIAYESGFNSQRTFNRVFKEMTGKTPAEYKNGLKKEMPNDKLAIVPQIRPVILRSESPPNWAPGKLKRNYMFRNYLKISWRNLLRNKVSSLINIGGLAVSMTAVIIIGLWIYDELSFNKYHQNYEHIARIMRQETWHGETGTGSSQTMPMGYTLRSFYGRDFKYVVMSTWTEGHVLSFGDKKFTQQGNYMQAEGPDMLTLKMIEGSRSGLKNQNSILLNASTAKKLFGESDPINQVLKIDTLEVKVTGVYADIPANSEFKDMSFVAPWDLLIASNAWLKQHQNDWNNQFLQIIVQINPNVSFEQVSSNIKDITLHHVSGDVAAAKPRMFLHPMSQWHLYSKFTNGVNVRSDALKYVWFYGIIGSFVLLLAFINFMNLSTARSEKRAKEVSIRKVMGSARGQLISQFYCESILIAAFSFAVAIGLAKLSLSWFNSVASKDIVIPFANAFFWLAGIGFILVTGLLAGSYPALYLSSFNPVKALKGAFIAGRFAAVPRKALVVLQYTISIALIIGTLVVYRQIQFTKNRPVGYSRDGLLTLQMVSPDYQGKFEVLKNELKNTGVVTDVAASVSPVTGLWRTNDGFVWQGKDPGKKENFGTLTVTSTYGKTIGWQVTAGRDFSATALSDSSGIVVNEAAVKYMGLNNPVGQYVHWDKKGKIFKILGVVKDMVMDSPFKPAYPTLFFLQGNTNWLFIKINPLVSATSALPRIEKVFKKIVPSAPFDYKFVDDDYASKFAAEERVSQLAGAFSGLAIFISCIGLFGMASFIAERRIKEIGLRKILGASVFNLWRLLSRDFLILVVISMLIAAPVAWYFMRGWLQNYEYRVSLSWWIFAVAGAGAILITLFTVSYQSIKTALTNPVKSLRSE